MAEKTFFQDFILGYNPIVSRRSLGSPYEEYKEFFGFFSSMEVSVGRFAPNVFQVRVKIIGLAAAPDHIDNIVTGMIGDTLQLVDGLRLHLIGFSGEGSFLNSFSQEKSLRVKFIRE